MGRTESTGKVGLPLESLPRCFNFLSAMTAIITSTATTVMTIPEIAPALECEWPLLLDPFGVTDVGINVGTMG